MSGQCARRSAMTADAAKTRSWPRFSLRSLVLFVALCGPGYGLWHKWEPWVVFTMQTRLKSAGPFALLSRKRLLTTAFGGGRVQLWDLAAQRKLLDSVAYDVLKISSGERPSKLCCSVRPANAIGFPSYGLVCVVC